MQPENSQNRNSDLLVRLALLHAVETGHLDLIECPQCHEDTVTVFFTHPLENEYRTWFICETCSFKTRMQNSGQPRYYSPSRVDNQLEEYDSDLLGRRRLDEGSLDQP